MGGCAGKSKDQAVDRAGDEERVIQETQPTHDGGANSNNDGSTAPRLSTISTPSPKCTPTKAKGAFNSSYMQKRAMLAEQTHTTRAEEMRHGLDERTRKLEQCKQDGEQLMQNSQRFSLLSEMILLKSQAGDETKFKKKK